MAAGTRLHSTWRVAALAAVALAAGTARPASAQAVHDVYLSPELDASVCNGGHQAGFDSQVIQPDADGEFDEVWSLTTPVTRVIGYVDETAAEATLLCIGGGATGHFHALRSPGDPQYAGTYDFNGQHGSITIVPRGPTLYIDDVRIEEGDAGTQDATFTVALSVASTEAVVFGIETVDFTAEAGTDYEATSLANLVLEPGETALTVTVPVSGDDELEDDETFGVHIVDAHGGASVSRANGVGTIVDDERPLLSIADATLAEGTGANRLATFSLTLSEISEQDVVYDIATVAGTAHAGSDFIADAQTALEIPAGALRRTFTVEIVGDTAIEANEVFTVELANVEGARVLDGEATGTIVNDDWPRLSVGDVAMAEGTGGARTATFPVRLDRVSPFPVTWSIATANGSALAGGDYTAAQLAGQVIPAGALVRYFNVPVGTDSTIEFDETFKAQLGNVSGALVADALGVATLVNDDFPALRIADFTLAEGNAGTKLATFNLRLDRAAPFAVGYDIRTVGVSAKAGSDYVERVLTGQVIPAYALSRTFSVTVNGDTVLENDETFDVKATNVVGASIADGVARGTLRNDDFPALSVSDAALAEGNAGTKLATFTVRLDRVAPWPVGYDIATADGTALAASDYEQKTLAGQSIPAGALARTFTVAITGDTAPEADETFSVGVTHATAATVLDGQGTGMIRNDDGAPAGPGQREP